MFLSIEYRFRIRVNIRNENVSGILYEYIFIFLSLMKVYIDRFVVLTYAVLIFCLSKPFQKITSKTVMIFLV